MQVQTALYVQDYYTGAIDGIVGPETRTAISSYQRANSMTITGTITAELLDALGIQAE
jgi:His-Xaa-Ser repeat protein HxsA